MIKTKHTIETADYTAVAELIIRTTVVCCNDTNNAVVTEQAVDERCQRAEDSLKFDAVRALEDQLYSDIEVFCEELNVDYETELADLQAYSIDELSAMSTAFKLIASKKK